MIFPQHQTTDYYQSTGLVPQEQTVDYFTEALGGVAATTPIVQAARALKRNQVRGLGQTGGDGWNDLVWVVVGLIALTGVCSYQAGKAMSPNKADGTKWGLVGVPIGLFGGPIGLGVMGMISNYKKR